MLGILSLTLLASAQQSAPPPFEMPLPAGFEDFKKSDDGMDVWTARRADGVANFQVSHYILAAAGAKPEAVIDNYRQNQWLPLLGDAKHTIKTWSGEIDSYSAAGLEIQYSKGSTEMMVLQRLTVQGDSMTMLVWEGVAAASENAIKTFEAFRIPPAWVPAPPPDVDIFRGLGPHGGALVFPGSFHIEVIALLAETGNIDNLDIDVTYVPGVEPVPSGDFQWQLPAGAVALPLDEDLGGRRVRYRLVLTAESEFGITRVTSESFSALDALWLAVPSFLLESEIGYQPPAWTLRVIHPPHLLSLGPTLQAQNFSQPLKARISDFTPVAAGSAWPYFLVAAYKKEQSDGLNWNLRLDSKAKLAHDAVRELVRLSKVLDGWLPGASATWTVASFPYMGDRVLPDLLVLDEQNGWFQSPVDAPYQGVARRVGLARLLCQQRFGSRLHGLGTAKLFLETSLAEYATYRLLEISGNVNDAQQLEAAWRKQERHAGLLPMPLSLLDSGDLFGPKRLLSCGPLVWQSIERKCGREVFDAMLVELLQSSRSWTTADLEKQLNKRKPDVDWSSFLRQHVYGRVLPTND